MHNAERGGAGETVLTYEEVKAEMIAAAGIDWIAPVKEAHCAAKAKVQHERWVRHRRPQMANDLIPRVLEGDVLSAGVQRSQNDDFALGDLVTRDGSDLHLVTYLTEDGYSGDFLCVQAPAAGWIAVGETETNLARRYSFVRTPVPGEFEVSNSNSTTQMSHNYVEKSDT